MLADNLLVTLGCNWRGFRTMTSLAATTPTAAGCWVCATSLTRRCLAPKTLLLTNAHPGGPAQP